MGGFGYPAICLSPPDICLLSDGIDAPRQANIHNRGSAVNCCFRSGTDTNKIPGGGGEGGGYRDFSRIGGETIDL